MTGKSSHFELGSPGEPCEPLCATFAETRWQSQKQDCKAPASACSARWRAWRSTHRESGGLAHKVETQWYVTPEDLAVWLKRAQSENERVYIKAKVDLRSDSGIETRWVGTAEIKALLTEGRIVKCHEAKISWVNVEHEWFWRRLRNRIVRLYGPRCMRCGRDGQVYLDHIQSWKDYPKRRYDPENLQLLCRDCHTWKHCQVTEWDFRKVKGLLNENDD